MPRVKIPRPDGCHHKPCLTVRQSKKIAFSSKHLERTDFLAVAASAAEVASIAKSSHTSRVLSPNEHLFIIFRHSEVIRSAACAPPFPNK